MRCLERGRTRVQDGKPFVWSIFGGNDNDQVTLSGGRKLIVTFREVLTAFVTAQRLRGTKGKLHYRVIDTTAHDGIDTLVYTSEQGDPIDFDSAVAPDFQVQYETFNPNYPYPRPFAEAWNFSVLTAAMLY